MNLSSNMNCNFEHLEFIMESILNNFYDIFLYDVANLVSEGHRQSYLDSILTNPLFTNVVNRYNIFVLNNNCGEELGFDTVNDITVYYGNNTNRIINNMTQHMTHLLKNRIIFIIVPNGIECDDKIISYLAFRKNNKERCIIFSADDYTKNRNRNRNNIYITPADIKVYEQLNFRQNITSADVIRVPMIAQIYTRLEHYPNRPRTNFAYIDSIYSHPDMDISNSGNTDENDNHRKSIYDLFNEQTEQEDRMEIDDEVKKKYIKYKNKYLNLKFKFMSNNKKQ